MNNHDLFRYFSFVFIVAGAVISFIDIQRATLLWIAAVSLEIDSIHEDVHKRKKEESKEQ